MVDAAILSSLAFSSIVLLQSKFDNIQTSNNMEYGIESMQENISGDISQMLDNVELFK